LYGWGGVIVIERQRGNRVGGNCKEGEGNCKGGHKSLWVGGLYGRGGGGIVRKGKQIVKGDKICNWGGGGGGNCNGRA